MARLRDSRGRLHSFNCGNSPTSRDKLTTGYPRSPPAPTCRCGSSSPGTRWNSCGASRASGLHTRGSGADNIRNLTCDPTSGVDPDELIETLPLVEALGDNSSPITASSTTFPAFNIAFHGGARSRRWRTPTTLDSKPCRSPPEAPPEGTVRSHGTLVTDRVAGAPTSGAPGGATGHKAFAQDLSVLGFVRRKSRGHRRPPAGLHRERKPRGPEEGRLKHLLEHWSLDRYRTKPSARTFPSCVFRTRRAGFREPPRRSPHPQVGIRPSTPARILDGRAFRWDRSHPPTATPRRSPTCRPGAARCV